MREFKEIKLGHFYEADFGGLKFLFNNNKHHLIMKKYIAVAALIAAGSAFANAADEIVYTPLENGEWVSSSNHSDRHSTVPNPTISDGAYSWATNWGQGYSTWDGLDLVLDSSDDYVSFSYTITTGNTNDGVMTLALVGTDMAIVTGFSYKGAIKYAVTTDNVAKDQYTFAPEASWGTVLSGTAMNSGTSGNTSYAIAGTVSWDESLSNFVLDLSLGGAVVAENIKLGETIDFSKLVISTDGGPQGPSYATLSDLTIKANSPVPEPSAFGMLAGVSALALVALRRRRTKKA